MVKGTETNNSKSFHVHVTRNNANFWREKMSVIYPRNIRFKCVKCGICCGNTQDILSRISDSIGKLSFASRRRTVEISGIREQTLEDHRAIVTALQARDPEAAQQAMLRHLNNVEQRMRLAG